jgi:hypothetical protein
MLVYFLLIFIDNKRIVLYHTYFNNLKNEDVEAMKLSAAVNISIGYHSPSRIQTSSDGAYSLVQGKDFDASHNLQEKTLLSFTPKRKPGPYCIHKGDVLFQARGADHFAYHVKTEPSNTLASSAFYILRIKTPKLLPEYLTWWLNQKSAQAYFKVHASNTAISFTSKHTLSNLKIEIPPFVIQKKIQHTIILLEHETALRTELTKKRSQLINELCLNAAHQKGEI